MTDTLYGWFSPECARLYGGSIYTRPDGSTVQVTDVHRTPDRDGNKWPDLEPVGEVVKWRGRFAGLHELPKYTPSPRPRRL